ncbi:hypothetical protein BIFGAL_04321 [Bifidobacterium gallicum DSM 20093 = LMG 11596]|nr:hypothetical protein BIFGAL_04321 [Bifidobacterium gallicum DSM 20093 = LMG 11596]
MRVDLDREHRIQQHDAIPADEQVQVPDDYYNAFLFFNMQAAWLEGHCVLGLGRVNGPITTYSFYRHGSAVRAPGKVAVIKDPEPFNQIQQAQGWIIHGAPGNYWNEHMDAALAMAFAPESYDSIHAYVEQLCANPPAYDLLEFNCYTAAHDALREGGIELVTRGDMDYHTVIPRDAFMYVTDVKGAVRFGDWKYWFPVCPAPKNSFPIIPDEPKSRISESEAARE